jgi:hypothetical protein
MKASGDLVIGRSGDRKNKFTVETRSRGEDKKPTTEALRLGERSGDRDIGKSGNREIGRGANNCHELKISNTAGTCRSERVEAHATPSRRNPTKIIPEQSASGSVHDTLNNVTAAGLYHGTAFSRAAKGKNTWASASPLLRRILQTIRATLREIFDESAYDRFLLRTGTRRTPASYRAFTSERDATMLKKPRCC